MGGITGSMSAVNGVVKVLNEGCTVKAKPTGKAGGFIGFTLVACLLPGLVQGGSKIHSTGGLQPLTNQQMAAVSGGTLLNVPVIDTNNTPGEISLDVLQTVAETLMPWLMLLESETSVRGVHFAEEAMVQIRHDGALELPMPSLIEQIQLKNLRMAGGDSMGSVTMHNLRFHPDSRLAISFR
ncbi:MAG: hypothetical protein EA349_05140 [Halomonadaceae bacterium]|nr:MAG: hypothetical protein EA349_05140 [Halomonadaceae bacterium]